MLFIRLTPKSARDEIAGLTVLADGRTALAARVRAAPEHGKANEALIRLIAKSLRVRLAAVHLESGGASRLKTVRIEGDTRILTDRLSSLCPCGQSGP